MANAAREGVAALSERYRLADGARVVKWGRGIMTCMDAFRAWTAKFRGDQWARTWSIEHRSALLQNATRATLRASVSFRHDALPAVVVTWE